MLFRSAAAILSGILFAQGTLAALTPAQVVTNIGIVTQVSGNINSALLQITTTSNFQTVQTSSQVLAFFCLPENVTDFFSSPDYSQRVQHDYQ